MLRELVQKFKVEITLKELCIWFALSFVGVLIVGLCIINQSMSSTLLIETFGFAVVFVLLMIGTKSYDHYISNYYQGHIDRHNAKLYKNDTKKNKKKKKYQNG